MSQPMECRQGSLADIAPGLSGHSYHDSNGVRVAIITRHLGFFVVTQGKHSNLFRDLDAADHFVREQYQLSGELIAKNATRHHSKMH